MTNTNREEWEELVQALAGHILNPLTLGQFGSARRCLSCNEPWPCPPSRAATLIENQGREIARYREALTATETVLRRMMATDGWPPPRLAARLSRLNTIVSTALQSPTQAPLQEGAAT